MGSFVSRTFISLENERTLPHAQEAGCFEFPIWTFWEIKVFFLLGIKPRTRGRPGLSLSIIPPALSQRRDLQCYTLMLPLCAFRERKQARSFDLQYNFEF
jgi:hypothetical protein